MNETNYFDALIRLLFNNLLLRGNVLILLIINQLSKHEQILCIF
jgi:hypothetical protein